MADDKDAKQADAAPEAADAPAPEETKADAKAEKAPKAKKPKADAPEAADAKAEGAPKADKPKADAPEAADAKAEAPDERPAEAEASPEAPRAEKPAPSRTAPPLPDGVHYIWGTGRRKRAVARVRIRPGSGKILINKREPAQYFPSLRDQNAVVRPLETSAMMTSWDVWVNVGGGGTTGQADAVSLGLARALSKAMPELDAGLRKNGLMTRDARQVERKKYGQRGARRRFQFSKR